MSMCDLCGVDHDVEDAQHEAAAEIEALRVREKTLQAALEAAGAALWRAHQMLSAINASDPSADRTNAARNAFDAHVAAIRAARSQRVS